MLVIRRGGPGRRPWSRAGPRRRGRSTLNPLSRRRRTQPRAACSGRWENQRRNLDRPEPAGPAGSAFVGRRSAFGTARYSCWPSQTSICDASSCANPNRQATSGCRRLNICMSAGAHPRRSDPRRRHGPPWPAPHARPRPVGRWSWNSAFAIARSPALRRRRVSPSRHVSKPGTRARRHRQAIAPVDLERLLGAPERRQESDRSEALRTDHLSRIP